MGKHERATFCRILCVCFGLMIVCTIDEELKMVSAAGMSFVLDGLMDVGC